MRLSLAQTPIRRLIALTLITSGTIAWFFVVDQNFSTLFQGPNYNQTINFVGKALFFGIGAFSAIIGALISGKIDKRKLLWSWIAFGVVSTFATLFFHGETAYIALNVLLGISLGLGFPASASLFASNTDAGERGRASGLLMLGSFVMVAIALLIPAFITLDLGLTVLLCIAVRSTSFLGLVFVPSKIEQREEKSWRLILKQRDFIFYLLPWILFNVATGLTEFIMSGLQIMPEFTGVLKIGLPLEYGSTAIACLISGFIADRYGRKSPIIIGIVLLGASFAILGIQTVNLTLLIHLAISGFAWGFLMVVYIAVPGDLALQNRQEKYYAIALLLPLVIYMGLVSLPDAYDLFVPANLLSPILSVILFLSVVPVLYARESLPESKIQSRKLKEHLDRVGKLLEESRKN